MCTFYFPRQNVTIFADCADSEQVSGESKYYYYSAGAAPAAGCEAAEEVRYNQHAPVCK